MRDKYEGWPEASKRFAMWRDAQLGKQEVTVEDGPIEFTEEDKAVLSRMKISWK